MKFTISNRRSSLQDKKIRFWDIRSGTEPIGDLEFGGKVTSVDVSRNGTWLLACCRDDTLRLVDARTCQLVRTYTTEGKIIMKS